MSKDQYVTVDLQKVKPIEDKWLAIALDTSPTDKTKVEELLDKLYQAKGVSKPPTVYVSNPIYGLRTATFAADPAQGKSGGTQRVIDYVNNETFKTDTNQSADFNQYGQFDSYWFIYWDYLFQFHPDRVKEYEKEVPVLMELAKHVSYYWVYDGITIVVPKVQELVIDNQKFDNKFGPAIKWEKFNIYALDGNIISKDEWTAKTLQYQSSLGKVIFNKI